MADPAKFPSLAVCLVLLVAFCGISVGQTAYLASLVSRRDFRVRSLRFLWEASVLVVALVGADSCIAGAYGFPPPPHGLFPDAVALSLHDLFWADVVSAVLGIFCLAKDFEPERIADIAAALIISSVGVALAGPWWGYCLIAAAALMSFGVMYRLLRMADKLDHVLTRVTPTRALQALDEGVLCVAQDGRVTFMNDSMREALGSMGLPGDLADQRHAWDRIESFARGNSGSVSADGVRVAVASEGPVLFFTKRDMNIGPIHCDCIVAIDVSEDDRLRQANEQANEALERVGAQLAESLEHVQKVAEEDARLLVHSRVHDVIGQRMSILHRSLEAGDVSAETVEKMEPLLTSILDDLHGNDETDPRSAYQATLDAFKMAGLSYQVTGSLPEDPDVAGLFVRVIREASTNAIRHGQATCVWVRMSAGPSWHRIRIENDGVLPERKIVEHGGLSGMRRAASSLGGTLEVAVGPRFTLTVTVPR